jgi:hypothetical protein
MNYSAVDIFTSIHIVYRYNMFQFDVHRGAGDDPKSIEILLL